MPKIHVVLTEAEIDEAVQKLREYADKVEGASEKIVEKLTEDGVEQAKELASFMGAYDSGELVDGIVPEYRDTKGYVCSTSGHAAYVEMGTGIVGSNNPNTNGSVPGWMYDVNEHGEAGWFYPGRDGRYHWTKGMPSRPYMYDTAQMMREAVPDVVRGVLQDDD